MTRSTTFRLTAILFLFAAFLSASSANADIRSRIREGTSDFKDISLDAVVKYSNASELKKISKDLRTTYEFKRMTVHYKAPDKLRLDGKVGIIRISMLISGDEKGYHFPIKGWQKQSIKGKPHERQSDLDIGLITDSIWRNYVVFDERTEMISGNPVFRITFAWANHRENKQICWVDADTLGLLKLHRMDAEGRLIASYVYSKHKNVSGISVPTRVEVYNGEGKLAGVTEYENIRVNSGIPESQFRF